MILAVFSLVLFSSGFTAHAKDTLKIGSILAVTGPASFLGDPELKTLQMYIDEINANGGINGHKIEFVHYDTKGRAKEAKNFVNRLIKKDKVDVIIGGTTSGNSLAVIDIVQRAKVPFISLAGSIKIVEPVKKWVFKTPHTDKMAAEKIFADMKKRGITKAALITGNGGFDKSGRAQCLAMAPKYGIEIVADEKYDNADTDMTTQLTKIRSTDAQAIINFGFGKAPAIVAKNIKQLGIKLPVYESHGVASKKFIELAGDAANGIRLPAAALIVADQLPNDDPQKKVLLAYKKKYEAKYGPVSTFGGHAYDALFITVEAVKRAGTIDRAKIRDEIENTHGFVGTGGVFNMSPTDHLGLNLDAFKMIEIENGNWKLLY
ncbi:MAG: ABC transporter substrate-binding protein [Thermodesulfobacteria bacterium]|nr:ABC transporter substrate-binding protein [Thermodesulfobacteriota bacterium]